MLSNFVYLVYVLLSCRLYSVYSILLFPCSTLAMRSAGGIEQIKKAIEGLAKYHDRHIMMYDPMLVSNN